MVLNVVTLVEVFSLSVRNLFQVAGHLKPVVKRVNFKSKLHILKLLSENLVGYICMERRYCLMWITHYDVLEFLHVLQLRGFRITLCGFVITFFGFGITLGGFGITLCGFGSTLCGFRIKLCGSGLRRCD